jgi:hypothetical protein
MHRRAIQLNARWTEQVYGQSRHQANPSECWNVERDVLMSFCAADSGEGTKEDLKQPSAVLRLYAIIINEMQRACPV